MNLIDSLEQKAYHKRVSNCAAIKVSFKKTKNSKCLLISTYLKKKIFALHKKNDCGIIFLLIKLGETKNGNNNSL